ncbi:DedA family protein [Agromyces archimandritae]|uniref:DedA family protein n=1 Tax=Agromyces archimandritae TaxID=2781962 RepID=A0A975FPV4_9MICO|nr:DedA family protein [Agromyces archimandritae]QTX04996.1 DedA family protein [Agromyces archimandritae]
MDALADLLVSLAASPWVPLVVFAVCLVDAFFPPVPSESVVVGVAAIAGGGTWIVVVAAALGAIVGDSIAYAIGRRIGRARFAWMQRPRVRRAVVRAARSLRRRGALAIFTARYIPVGRIAVNATAGATRYPYRRFLPLSILAGVSWALYSTFIGVAVGRLFAGQPLVAVVVAIVIAAGIGWAVDAAARAVRGRNARRRAAGRLAERHGAAGQGVTGQGAAAAASPLSALSRGSSRP